MKEYLPVLKKVPLFRGLTEEEILSLLQDMQASVRNHHKDQFIYLSGEKAGYIGIVLSGQIQIMQVDYDGRRMVLSAFGAGQVFAEAFACAGLGVMPVDILSVTASTILFLRADRILEAPDGGATARQSSPSKRVTEGATSFGVRATNGSTTPNQHTTGGSTLPDTMAQFRSNLLTLMARKNMMLNTKLSILSHNTTQEKLMAFLAEQARINHSKEFDIPYNRQALADYLGVERSAMSAELSKLQKRGLIETRKSHFKLLS